MYARYAYVTFQDLESLNHIKKINYDKDYENDENKNENKSVESGAGADLDYSDSDDENKSNLIDQQSMLLAIRAPPGSTLEIPSEA